MVMHLQRFLSSTHGVFGQLRPDGESKRQHMFTGEEESRGNKPRVSCIPAGTYVCKRRMYNKGGYETFEVTGVPGRSLILFHKGNTEEDIEGCILLGMGVGVFDVIDEDSKLRVPKLGVTQSGLAFGIFMSRMAKVDEFTLIVTDPGA
jgi:hypothetical protein